MNDYEVNMSNYGLVDVGDKVRAYDFASREDCYIEGTVVRVVPKRGHDGYEILVSKRVWSGEDEPDSADIGTYMRNFSNNVVKLSDIGVEA